jgi:hypothetical protein
VNTIVVNGTGVAVGGGIGDVVKVGLGVLVLGRAGTVGGTNEPKTSTDAWSAGLQADVKHIATRTTISNWNDFCKVFFAPLIFIIAAQWRN